MADAKEGTDEVKSSENLKAAIDEANAKFKDKAAEEAVKRLTKDISTPNNSTRNTEGNLNIKFGDEQTTGAGAIPRPSSTSSPAEAPAPRVENILKKNMSTPSKSTPNPEGKLNIDFGDDPTKDTGATPGPSSPPGPTGAPVPGEGFPLRKDTSTPSKTTPNPEGNLDIKYEDVQPPGPGVTPEVHPQSSQGEDPQSP